MNTSKGFITHSILIAIILLALGAAFYFASYHLPNITTPPQPLSPAPVACPQDAMTCPDGSYVRRVGPNCEFAVCPTASASTSTPTPALIMNPCPPGTIQTGMTASIPAHTICSPIPSPTPKPAPPVPPPATLKAGDNVKTSMAVNVTTDPLTDPAMILGTQPSGALGKIISGPRKKVNSTSWWEVDFANSPDGYVSGDYLLLTLPPTPGPNTQTIIKKVGEQEGSFLIQKINYDSVDGLWYTAYPVAGGKTPKTLHIGDDIGYACEGVSEKLTRIDFSGQTVTFAKITGKRPYGGCPI